MGDRAQVRIVPSNVYLYGHWIGDGIRETVRTALARKERWDDPEYLARIIFCEMLKSAWSGEAALDGETGYGIGTEKHGDLNVPLITVDCDEQTVTVGHAAIKFSDFIGASR